MSSPATLSALVLVLALVPGWFYLRMAERLGPPSGSSGLHQLLEVLAVGAATTGVSVLLLVLLPHRLLPFALDVPTWVASGDVYLRSHVQAAAWSAVLVFATAAGLAYVLYRLRAWTRPAEFRGQGDVWIHGIGERPSDTHPYLGVHLTNGWLVEGPLHSYTFGAEPGKRDVALAGPIRVTTSDGGPRALPHVDRFVVSESKIDYITVIFAPAARDEQRWARRGLRRTGGRAAAPAALPRDSDREPDHGPR